MCAESALIDDRGIGIALDPYGFSPTSEQCAKIRVYIGLLLRWNRSLSLTTVTGPLEIVGRHFGESIFATKLMPVENCRLVDIGTGPGFPGIALKIAEPTVHLELVESNKKKCVFLAEVIRALEFANVKIRAERIEQIRPEGIEANIITSRAVGNFKELLRWSARALAKRGHVAFWLGGEDSTTISNYPGWTWQPPAKLPDSQRRFILVGRPAVTLAKSR